MKRHILLTMAVILSISIIMAASTFAQENYSLVFEALLVDIYGQLSNGVICQIDPSGQNFRSLSSKAEKDATMPSCSPDGRYIAFVSFRDGNAELYLMNSDGTNEIRLTNTAANEYYPSFSSDGKFLVFNRIIDKSYQIVVMELSSRREVQITKGSNNFVAPKVSPDDTKIVCYSDLDGTGRYQIYVLKIDGTQPTKMTKSDSGQCVEPNWSPNGKEIVFVYETAPSGDSYLYVVSNDQQSIRALTSEPAKYYRPCWSPDGKKIAFSSNYGDADFTQLFTINPDGTGITQITEYIHYCHYPTWLKKSAASQAGSPGPQTAGTGLPSTTQPSGPSVSTPTTPVDSPAKVVDGAPIFRGMLWGMTKAQVKAAEKASLVYEDTDLLIFSDKQYGMPCNIIYLFFDDYLYVSSMTIDVELTDYLPYIQAFNSNKAELTAKYGNPTTDQVKWTNNKYKNDPAQWGTALKEGHVSFYCEWNLKQVIVSSTLERSKEGLVSWMLIFSETL